MIDKELKNQIQKQLDEFQVNYLVGLLEKLLNRKPTEADSMRLKTIPLIGKNMSYMISLDDVIVGVVEGRFDYVGGKLGYKCDYIPAEDYKAKKAEEYKDGKKKMD